MQTVVFMRPRACALAVASAFSLLAASTQPVWAQGATPATGRTQTLETITVTAQPEAQTATSPVTGYIAKRAATASKSDTPLIETPQSVTVVTRDEMIDQGAQNLQDALNYAAGVRSDAYGLDSRTDSYRIRGSEPSTYLDGLRQNYNWYTSTTRVEPYMLERIEVLRGPASMLYGQGSTAGVVNMVSKRPLAEAQNEVGISYGTHNRKQLQADFTGPLTEDGTWLYRLVAVGRKADTQVDHVPDDRMMVAPSLTWRPSARTSLTLQALWQDDKSGSTSQFFPWEGVAIDNPNGPLSVHRFIGEPDWDRYDSKRQSLGWLFEHEFNDNWAVRQNFRWAKNEVDYRSLYGDSFTLPGGWAGDPVNKRLFGRYADATLTKVNMLTADQHLAGKFDTGAVSHQMLLGFDLAYAREEKQSGFDAPVYLGGSVPLIDAYNPVYGNFTPPAMSDDPTSRQRDTGFYLQDQMKFGQNWIVVAGLRHDRSVSSVEGDRDQTSTAVSKRLGLMYAADNGWSPYLSYSESFTPVSGLNADNDRFVPMRGEQVEAGLKYESEDGDTLFNASVYSLRESNRLVPDPTNPNNSIQAGKTKNKGLELELKTVIGRQLDLMASYNYIDLDDALEGMPKHQASVWGKYRFAIGQTSGFSAGAGVRWLGSFSDGPAPETPSVTLVDAMLAYETDSWRYALNATNLFNKTYVSTCLGRGDCWWGAQRSIIATATYRF
ncbi:TonB-dependent siderophore receptor [Pusillimonas sp. SM2304]|uniref:TonB-dependent siderophore receptor n=1 Tax=Pusillimonas sp. SM2304 TaxID=3073241 RepID=UPI002874D8DE|nr:TonB-dependent siderophore receptor [Pusillimonas sp. SM2304]MDS1140230.1 TonB-dependent siderophore receptor [Pusillimonas sp. SM2304]